MKSTTMTKKNYLGFEIIYQVDMLEQTNRFVVITDLKSLASIHSSKYKLNSSIQMQPKVLEFQLVV